MQNFGNQGQDENQFVLNDNIKKDLYNKYQDKINNFMKNIDAHDSQNQYVEPQQQYQPQHQQQQIKNIMNVNQPKLLKKAEKCPYCDETFDHNSCHQPQFVPQQQVKIFQNYNKPLNSNNIINQPQPAAKFYNQTPNIIQQVIYKPQPQSQAQPQPQIQPQQQQVVLQSRPSNIVNYQPQKKLFSQALPAASFNLNSPKSSTQFTNNIINTSLTSPKLMSQKQSAVYTLPPQQYTYQQLPKYFVTSPQGNPNLSINNNFQPKQQQQNIPQQQQQQVQQYQLNNYNLHKRNYSMHTNQNQSLQNNNNDIANQQKKQQLQPQKNFQIVSQNNNYQMTSQPSVHRQIEAPKHQRTASLGPGSINSQLNFNYNIPVVYNSQNPYNIQPNNNYNSINNNHITPCQVCGKDEFHSHKEKQLQLKQQQQEQILDNSEPAFYKYEYQPEQIQKINKDIQDKIKQIQETNAKLSGEITAKFQEKQFEQQND